MREKREKIYQQIDQDIEKHILRFQEFIRQRSISQTGEGIEECAELLKTYLGALGCQTTRLVEGQYSPIVYAKYNAGAEKTLIVYSMYDVQPADDISQWQVPPFEGKIVEMTPFKKVLMGRGAINTKGPLIAFVNAVSTIKIVDELPVNLIFIVEGEEERGSVSMPEFVRSHQNELKQADAVYFTHVGQDENGLTHPLRASEGVLYIELETSGARWERGPTNFGIHGSFKLIVDSPAWRHIKMLSSLVSDDGNRVLIKGWYDNIVSPTEEDFKLIHEGYRKGAPYAEVFDPELWKKIYRFPKYINNMQEPEEILTSLYFGTSFNLDGIWGGWTGEGTKTLLPHKVTSKHNIRFIPHQNLDDLFQKIRNHLDDHSYHDVELRKLAGYSWAVTDYKSEIAEAAYTMFEEFKVKYTISPPAMRMQFFFPAWPAYVFARDPLNLPVIGAGLGYGGRAHSPNEFFVIEGAPGRYNHVYGLAGAEKSMVSLLYNFAGITKNTN
ncbi:MAG: M20/M25/M40 family metallo-hydrolase [Candidatus Hodarchaeales archaeon]|jgi:acetylornithine deacetylase/succinyl-diaminopimelate desuccinylase-like protein